MERTVIYDMLEYGWVFVTGVLTLLGGYLTILNINEKKNQPIDRLISQYSSLDKSVTSLNNILSSLDSKLNDFIKHSEDMQKGFKEELGRNSTAIHNHETRITVLEKENEIISKNKHCNNNKDSKED